MSWKQDPEYPLSQNLDTEFGRLTLEHNHGDRGSWRFTTMTELGKHNRVINLIPKYFFDEDAAKLEIEQWLNIARRFVDNVPIPDVGGISLKAEKVLHGKFCMITVGKFYTTPEVFSGSFINVVVPREIERWLSVDWQDEFPRLFVNEVIAQNEAEDWLWHRGQKTDFSSWYSLD